jgi:hypothetical protein
MARRDPMADPHSYHPHGLTGRRGYTVRARTPCRLAVLRRDRQDSEALLGVAAQQTARLEERRPRIWETQVSDGIAARYLSAVT